MSDILKQRFEPLIGGIQIQNRKRRKGIGTLGCIVFDNATGIPLGLSNKHIVKRKLGKKVIQPASKPKTDHYVIGTVFRKSKKYDCAVFKIDETLRTYDQENSIYNLIGKITETVTPVKGMKVQKVGQNTGHTYGIVDEMQRKGKFTIIPNPDKPSDEISDGGDSGSIWVTDEEDFKAVGLHTGGEDDDDTYDKAWALKIDIVLNALKVRF